jgi:sugar/nucleoside kinase (ribokinase family)
MLRERQPRVQAGDDVGAGANLAAGFVAATISGWPLDEALRLGVACAVASTRAPGGVDGQVTLEEAEALMRGA